MFVFKRKYKKYDERSRLTWPQLVMDYNPRIMSTLKTLQSKKNQIIELAAKYGASNVRLFGSVCRGDEREDSDVDLLVDMQESRNLFDLIGLQQDLEKMLGKKVDVITPNGIHRHLRGRILAEAAPL